MPGMIARWLQRAILGLGMAALTGAAAASAGAAELHVYAGAGLREAVEAVAAEYRQQTGNEVAIEYGGSGQMLARINETGRGDVFVSGAMPYIDKLEAAGGVLSKRPLALHGAVLVVNKAAANRIKSFDDLAQPGVRIALGDPQAMAWGRTAEEILSHTPLKDAILANVVVRAATMNQLALYVVNGDVDAALVGHHDLMKNPEALVAVPVLPSYYQSEIVGAAVLKVTTQPAEAARFVDLLASSKGRMAFHAAGFPPVDTP